MLPFATDEAEFMANSHVQLVPSLKEQLLWKLFHVSSLAQDWGTCLNAVEETLDVNNLQDGKYCDLARSFALLQCRRPSAAREILHLKKALKAQSLLITAELYSADALLNEKTMESNDGKTPLVYTQHALDFLSFVSRNKKSQNSSSFQELQVTANNNHGIALLIAGDSTGALCHFQKAAKYSSLVNTNYNVARSWLLFPASFNLALLLLRDGHLEESVKIWLNVRGHLLIWQKAVNGDHGALRELKDRCEIANNCHGFLMAKRSMKAGALELDRENIMEWVPPVVEPGNVNEDSSCVGGVDASQITALDVLLLRCAASMAEKKTLSSFRMKVT